MKKKCLISFIIVTIMMSFAMLTGKVQAYTAADYSIDVPSSYTSAGTNKWKKSNGDNFNVQIRTYTGGLGNQTLDEALNDILDGILKGNLYEDIKVKEVADITDNNYRGIHIKAKLKGYSLYADQYEIVSKGKIFVLTFVSSDEEYLDSDEIKDTIKSFEITKYERPEEKETKKESKDKSTKNETVNFKLIAIVIGSIIGIIICAVITISGLIAIIKHSKKNK